MTDNTYQELMPKNTFDQTLENIEALAKVFFETYQTSRQIDVGLQKETLQYIGYIEKDVLDTMSLAYKSGTFDSYLQRFYEYSTNINYAIYNVINGPKFDLYFKLFKQEATLLKFEAVDFALDSLRYRQNLSALKKSKDSAKGGKSSSPEWKHLKLVIKNIISEVGIVKPDEILKYIKKHQLLGDGFYGNRAEGLRQNEHAIAYKTFQNYVTSCKKNPSN